MRIRSIVFLYAISWVPHALDEGMSIDRSLDQCSYYDDSFQATALIFRMTPWWWWWARARVRVRARMAACRTGDATAKA